MKHAAIGLVAAVALTAVSLAAQTQIVKSVTADGTVTYSDRAGVAGDHVSPFRPFGVSSSAPALPYDLREKAQRYPVIFYAAPSCSACDAARAALITRGIPFAEKTIVTPEDVAALRALTGEAQVPALRIGSQPLSGYAADTWQRYFDAAGYPATSRLPAGWRNPEATSLTPAQAAPRSDPADE